MSSRRPRDGMVLGATVGAGFAAFESAGYAFSALVHHQGDHPVLSILQTEISRAVLAPFGHITWTALFGGALFAAARSDGRFRLTWPLTGTIVGIIALHALWDQSYGWAILLTKGLRDGTWNLEWPATEAWVGLPTGSELVVWQVVYDGLLAVNAAVGVAWVVISWRRYRPAADGTAVRTPADTPSTARPSGI
jgi:protease PrsW